MVNLGFLFHIEGFFYLQEVSGVLCDSVHGVEKS